MSWPVPPSAQWNPGVAMTPNMNMGYTPDQWALMQQQNWQQWTQWQQQYAQWHSQYGDKYAEQMQAMPTMGTMPPLPPVSCVPPPAPPPPDQPPPPHQNDQPLFTQKPPPPPVPAPPQNQQTSNKSDNENNTKTPEVDTQSWSYDTHTMDTHDDAAQNSEALEKLSEEERLFDIQFQKWEEEIEKWKKENVNHPDKQAYNEYEQKFEACRAQLLERRQQMKQKRARLMSNTSQTVNNNVMGNMPTVPAPGCNPVPLQTKIPNNYSQPNMQSQKLKNNPTVNYFNQKYPHYQQHNMSEGSYSSDTKYVEPTFRNDSYHNVGHYSSPNVDNSDFLPKEDTKGIPGLDLVPEVDKPPGFSKNQDVIDITEENKVEKQEIQSLGPDYSTISKGINSILGDEKIMNILSMVRGQKSFDNTSISKPLSNMDAANSYQHTPNIPYGSRQNTNNVQSSFSDIPKTSNDMPVVQRQYDDKRVDISKEQYYGNFMQSSGQNMAPRNVQITASQVGPLQNQAMQNESINNFHRGSYDRKSIPEHPSCPMPTPPVRSKWVDEPLFTPSIIVEYEHKPLRLKARDFIEPVHMFDYNHKSKESDKKKDFEREVDDLFSRQRKMEINDENFSPERSYRDLYYRDNNRKPRENIRDDYRQRGPLREAYSERHRYDDKYDNRQRDHSDNYKRREDIYRNYERGRDDNRDRYRDYKKDESRNRSRSKERENRKRAHSKDSEVGTSSIKKGKDALSKNDLGTAKHIVMIDDILEPPGREMRPEKIVIILRGLPGSGKSYLAKLIRDKEAEHGGTVRIMSIDDYFMQEGEIEVNDPVTGKMVKKPSLKYEYDQDSEEAYMYSLKRAFKRSLTDGYFSFLIFDAVNEQLKSYADVWNFARQNGFQVYICTLEVDLQTCYKRNIHNRTLEDIEIIRARFFPTPAHHIQLDPTTLLQSAAITEVQMEDVDNGVSMEEDPAESEVENHFTSKWEKMDDAAQLARLDGTSKPLRPSQLSMEDYLQIDDWQPNVSKPGKKTVRWADIEERRKQEKMRAIGFVVGQTDWNRMTDPTMGSSALTQTKYIERVRRM